jgi:hypothetical protein
VSRRSSAKRRRQEALLAEPPASGAVCDESFSAVELDFFKRAEELYKTSFETWEDFEPEVV